MRIHCFLSVFLILSFYRLHAVCTTGQTEVIITIIPDNYPLETSWSLRDGVTNALIDTGGVNSDTVCVTANRCMRFTIFDSFGDGLCCGYGNGSYTVKVNGTTIVGGGSFTYRETTTFSCPVGSDCTNTLAAIKDTMTAPFPNTWYAFIPDSSGTYIISTCALGNICDTKIYVYDHCTGLIFDENNTGTNFYDDDGCGVNLQSFIPAALTAGNTYYIRIGDYDTSCAGRTINWQINFQGAISGCTNPLSCNYNPLATIDDSSCIYPPNPLCGAPDLTVDELAIETSMFVDNITAGSANCYVSEGCLAGYGLRRIIRFTTHIRNIGNLDYYIGWEDTVGNQFVFDACHGHWHYRGYAEYLLYDQNNQPLQQGFKNGFCVMDLECSGGGVGKYDCGNMGISAGCGDIYSAFLDCQWVDITDIDTGNYTLVVRVNWDQSPDRLGRYESTYSNNWAQVCFHLEYDNLSNKVFSLNPNCVPYVDCAGDTLGNAVIDCNGICSGTGVRGDVNLNFLVDDTDVNLYLTEIKDETIVYSVCNDLNGDGEMNITDAARLNGCLRESAGTHQHPTNYQNTHKHCEFPFNIYNPFDSVTFSIADTDLMNHYIDISVYNPSCRVMAYEFKLHGLVVDSVKNLALGNYQPDIRSSASGHVVGITADENSLFKQLAPLNFMRVYFDTLTDTQICITEIVAVVNSNYEEVKGKIGNGCADIPQKQDTVISNLDFAAPESLSIIPNPSSGIFELYLKNRPLTGAEVKVADALGNIVYQFNNSGLSNHLTLDLSVQPGGIYFLQMNVKGNLISKRLVLTKQ